MITEVRTRHIMLPVTLAAAILAQTALASAQETKASESSTQTEEKAEQPKGLLAILFKRTDKAEEKAEADAEKEVEAALTGKSPAPAHLRSLIHKVAAEHGVPPALAEAVVNVESRFNPKARGRAGEVGLMQIKPATARGIGYRGTTKGLYDPETNLAWGMRYLARAYQLADGDTCGAIMRYNAGHAAKRMTKGVVRYCAKVQTYVAGL